MRLILQGQFKGFNGQTHSVDIYDTSLASGGTPIDLTLRGQGYELDWNANISQVVKSGIIQSSAKIYIQNIDNELDNFLNLLDTSGENRFIVDIQRGGSSFWKGVILQDFGGVDDKPESLITLQATDGVGILLSKEIPDLSADFEKITLIETIINGLNEIPTEELFLTVDVFAKVRTDWFNALIPDNTVKDPLDYVSVLNSDGSILWIKRTTREGYNGSEVVDESKMNYKEVIEHILTRFNSILVMNNGVWYIVQRDLWEAESMRYFRYTKECVTSGLMALETTFKSIDDNMYRSEGSFLSLPGIKDTEVTYLANFESYNNISSLLPSSFTVGSSHTTHPLLTGTGNYLDISINFKDVFDTSEILTTYSCRAQYTLTVRCGSYYLYLDIATNEHKWTLTASTIDVLSAPLTNINNQYSFPTITATILWQRITDDIPENAEIEISLEFDKIISYTSPYGSLTPAQYEPQRLDPPNVTKIVANTYLLYIYNNQTPTSTAKFISENTNTNYSLENKLEDSMFGSAGIGGCMGLIYTYDGSQWVWSIEDANKKWDKGYTTTPKTRYFNELLVDEVQANQSKNLLVFTGTIIDRNDTSQLNINQLIKLTYKGTSYYFAFNFVRYNPRLEEWTGDWFELSRVESSSMTETLTALNEFIKRPLSLTTESASQLEEITGIVSSTGFTMPHTSVNVKPIKGRTILKTKTNGQTILKRSTGEEVIISQEREQTPVYGALYNWYAATNVKGIVNPLDTFTVPTLAQFDTLITYLGGSSVAGSRLKSNNIVPDKEPSWDYGGGLPPSPNTNDVSFSAEGAGERRAGIYLGAFSNKQEANSIWVSDEIDANNGKWKIIYQSENVGENNEVLEANSLKENGGSIRLVRTATVEEQALQDGAIVDNYVQNDGNEIICVKIGTQVWTAECITETKYADGTTIPIIEDNTDWSNDSTGAMCYYDNDVNNAYEVFPVVVDVYEEMKELLSAGDNVTIDFDDNTETITISAQTSDESFWEYVDSLLTHIQPKDTSSGQAKIYIEHIDPTETEEETPTDTDYFNFWRGSYLWKKITFANIKSTLKTYFDTLYTSIYLRLIGAPTYTTVQDWNDTTQSAGILTGGEITSNGDGTVAVSAISGILKTTDSDVGQNVFFTISSLSSLTITDNSTNFIYIDYNSGSPQILANTSNLANGHTTFNIAKIYREGNNIDVIDNGLRIYDIFKRIQQHHVAEASLHITSGGVVSEVGTRNIAITAATIYAGLNLNTSDAINTSTGDTFEYYYKLNGIWVESDETQINNAQYNLMTPIGSESLASLLPNRYGVHWVFKGTNGNTFVLFGQGNYTLTEAQNATLPSSLPPHISGFSVLRAKIIIQESSSTFLEIDQLEEGDFNSISPSNHNELGGLQGGTASQYYHLTSAEYSALGTYVDYYNTAITTSATPTPTGNYKRNNLFISALTDNATFGVPTGTPVNGNRIFIRVTSATSKTLSWNAIYNGSMPISIDTETLYLEFVYNSNTSKWEYLEAGGGGGATYDDSYLQAKANHNLLINFGLNI